MMLQKAINKIQIIFIIINLHQRSIVPQSFLLKIDSILYKTEITQSSETTLKLLTRVL